MVDEAMTADESVSVASAEHKASRLRRGVERIGRFLRRNSISVYALVLAFFVLLLVLAPQIFITIPAGHVGVLWLRFLGGTVTTSYMSEGLHIIFPWDEVIIYDARLQNRARVYDTISSNGLGMKVEIAIRYRINRDTVGLLHQMVGPGYDEVLVYPEIGSHARELISRYTPEQLYSETRAFIQAQLLERMVTQLGASLGNQSVRGRLVDVEDVLVRSVTLPPRVQDAIERKAEQYQATLEYDFRIQREKKERERKKIEAEGIRDFQETIARTITPEYLRLRGIEATLNLAASQNTKIIVVGGKDGLPLILNTGDEGGSAPAPAQDPKLGGASSPSLSNAPPNARMNDVAPTNAAVPMGPTAASATVPPAMPVAPATAPVAVPSVDTADTGPAAVVDSAADLPHGESGIAATTDTVPAKVDGDANPASKEPSLLEELGSGLSKAFSSSAPSP